MVDEQVESILSAGLQLLKEVGCEGFSIQKVSEQAALFESTVLLYFKNKHVLLDKLFEDFINRYFTYLQAYQKPSRQSGKAALSSLLFYILKYRENSGNSDLFKEFWASANHHRLGRLAYDQYYRELYAQLYTHLQTIAPVGCAVEQLQIAVSIVLPFIEGYSITRSTLPISILQLTDQLANCLAPLLFKTG
ncbi:TetR family transcriptional regulator [Psychromonas sp. MME2]|uniref:TetR/AcrR family transcriptional regulator n=1 Tax=Psychromonas sp. MME2 TaxID=3231033 RepID=UPI00339BD55E